MVEVGLVEKSKLAGGEEVREVAMDELTPQIKAKLDELAEQGNQFVEGEMDE